jgi:CRISPR-associated protein Cas5d
MSIKLEIWGEYACFTRPECKVERMSYSVPTPSAMRGVIEAIYWKPEISWHIDSIRVLEPIRWISIRRNEVSERASIRSKALIIEDCRQQRNSLLLRDVRYLVSAHFIVRRSHQAGRNESENTPEKHLAVFTRCATAGQHFTQPYLGCREFPAYYRLVQSDAVTDNLPAHQRNQNLGWMLCDLGFDQDLKTKVVRKTETQVFYAVMRDGVINTPPRRLP